jgi:hypothetical protein
MAIVDTGGFEAIEGGLRAVVEAMDFRADMGFGFEFDRGLKKILASSEKFVGNYPS